MRKYNSFTMLIVCHSYGFLFYTSLFFHLEDFSYLYHESDSVKKWFYKAYPFPHIDAFWRPDLLMPLQQTNIWKHCDNRKNEQIFLLPQRFQLFLIIKFSLINKDFPTFCLNVLKIVCWRFALICRVRIKGYN